MPAARRPPGDRRRVWPPRDRLRVRLTTNVRRSRASEVRSIRFRSSSRSRMLVSVERRWPNARCTCPIVDSPALARCASTCASAWLTAGSSSSAMCMPIRCVARWMWGMSRSTMGSFCRGLYRLGRLARGSAIEELGMVEEQVVERVIRRQRGRRGVDDAPPRRASARRRTSPACPPPPRTRAGRPATAVRRPGRPCRCRYSQARRRCSRCPKAPGAMVPPSKPAINSSCVIRR